MTEDAQQQVTRWGRDIARWNARREKERAAVSKPRAERAKPRRLVIQTAGSPPASPLATSLPEPESSE